MYLRRGEGSSWRAVLRGWRLYRRWFRDKSKGGGYEMCINTANLNERNSFGRRSRMSGEYTGPTPVGPLCVINWEQSTHANTTDTCPLNSNGFPWWKTRRHWKLHYRRVLHTCVCVSNSKCVPDRSGFTVQLCNATQIQKRLELDQRRKSNVHTYRSSRERCRWKVLDKTVRMKNKRSQDLKKKNLFQFKYCMYCVMLINFLNKIKQISYMYFHMQKQNMKNETNQRRYILYYITHFIWRDLMHINEGVYIGTVFKQIANKHL